MSKENLVTLSISINQYKSSVKPERVYQQAKPLKFKALAVIKYLNTVTMIRESVIFAAVAGVGPLEHHQAAFALGSYGTPLLSIPK